MKNFYLTFSIILIFLNSGLGQTLTVPDNLGTSSNSGNVGIGTTTPTSKLSIRNTGGSDGVKLLDFSENNTEEFLFKGYFAGSEGAGNKLILGTGIGTTGWQSNIMSWRGNGNVGIGVISPLEKLHIDNGALQFLNMGENINDVDIIKIGENASVNEFTLQGMFEGGGELSNKIKFRSMWKDNLLVLQGDGKIGIDVANPNSVLSIYGSSAASWNSGIELNREGGGKGWIVVDSDGMKFRTPVDGDGFYFRDKDNNTSMFVEDGGNVGIGTTTPAHKLDVKGTIHAKEVIVDLEFPGPDYVFEPEYDLNSLADLDKFLKTNKHLPEVPSATQMKAEGINMVEMQMLLLKKVEELTLHLIEQSNLNQKQSDKIELLQEEIYNLKNNRQ